MSRESWRWPDCCRDRKSRLAATIIIYRYCFRVEDKMTSKSFDELSDEMLNGYLKINPDAGTALGIHEPYDWQLPHGGFKKLEESLAILESWYKKANGLATSEELDVDQRLSIKTLKTAIDVVEFSIEDYPIWKMYPDAFEWFGGLLFVMVSRDYAPFDQRVSAICSRLGRLPKYLEQFRTRFKDPKSVHVWTRIAISVCESMPGFLRVIEESSRGRVSESLHEDLRKGVSDASAAIDEHLQWLKEMLDRPNRSYAMGKKRLAKLMKLRGIDFTPAEVLALGEKYLREFKEEKARVAESIAPGKGVDGAASIVRSRRPRTFEEALRATEHQMNQARMFISDANVATVDPNAILKVIETPAFLAPLMPFAAMYMPAKFDRTQEGVYIVTRPKGDESLGERLNYAAIINTALHEAYPGHFHQGVMTNKKPIMLQLAGFGGDVEYLACATETVEGWAHYCEKMMFDHGYEATDEAAFEMYTGAIWRACRIIADVKLAQGEASIEEATEMMATETGMPRDAMEDEVKRYSHMPGQALSYMLGRHLILELRADLERRLGPRFNEKAFHDTVASYGFMPFHLVKETVLSELKA